MYLQKDYPIEVCTTSLQTSQHVFNKFKHAFNGFATKPIMLDPELAQVDFGNNPFPPTEEREKRHIRFIHSLDVMIHTTNIVERLESIGNARFATIYELAHFFWKYPSVLKSDIQFVALGTEVAGTEGAVMVPLCCTEKKRVLTLCKRDRYWGPKEWILIVTP